MSCDLPDIPVPASQLVTLEKKLNEAKAQLKKKTTKADNLKVRQLKKNSLWPRGCLAILENEKLQQKETIFNRLQKCQRTYLNDSYLLVCVLQRKISRS